ncbi:MAG TPA: M56 family metallopeptidase, partial [Acidobacteriaceae bacterium]|nr:M56 family metallopeptidase [Acidobacteriaceae bacterium]
MHPETQLAIVAAFAGFLLKTFLGFCICWAISKILASPRRKFLVWFAFLSIAGAYWLSLIVGFIPHAAPELALPAHTAASSLPVAHWQLQSSWAYPLLVIERVLGGLYLVALGNFLWVRIKKQLRLRWVLRFAYKAPDRIENMFRSIAIHSGVKNIELLVLSGIYSPATFGWIHPVILLPPVCLEQDESELADILRHELQHVARHDFFFNNVAGFCRTLLFFHPALWYAMRRMELESELASDLAVVCNSPERRATYAECLVRFARLHAAQDPTPWNLDFAGSSIQLKVRVRSVLTETAKIPGWLLGLRTSIGVLLFAGFLCMAPSLFVVLSYAHRAAPPIVPSLVSSRDTRRSRKRSRIRVQEPQKVMRAIESPTADTAAAPLNQSEASRAVPRSVPRQSNTLSSGEPVPTLQQRGSESGRTNSKPAKATVIFISNPSSISAGNSGSTKG